MMKHKCFWLEQSMEEIYIKNQELKEQRKGQRIQGEQAVNITHYFS